MSPAEVLRHDPTRGIVEHMFDALTHPDPAPWDPAHAQFEDFEERAQVAFLNSLVFTAEDRLDAIRREAREANRCQGRQLRTMAEFIHEWMTHGEPGRFAHELAESAATEIGLALGLTPSTVSDRTRLALGLTRRLPAVLSALEAGEITLAAAKILLEETENLSIGDAARVANSMLNTAAGRIPSSLRKMTRRRVMRLDADAARKRREKAVRERDVTVTPAPDGMAWLTAHLPAEQAHAMYGVITDHATARIPGDERPLSARRADTLADMVLRPDADKPRAAFVLHLHGGTSDSTDTDDDPALAELPGYGPIPAQAAHDAADLISRAASDPIDLAATLATLNANPDTYAPSAKLARAIQARDKHCRFPGCRVPATRCELDHTIGFKAGGRTIYVNLAALCKFHHRIKHMPGWTCTQGPDGTLTWTTPSGRIYPTRPAPYIGDPPPDFDRPAQPAEDSARDTPTIHLG